VTQNFLFLVKIGILFSASINAKDFFFVARALESVVTQNRLDMNALVEAARQAPIPGLPQSGEGASGSGTKDNEMIANQPQAGGGEASGRSAQPGAWHAIGGMQKSYKACFRFFCLFNLSYFQITLISSCIFQ
jgi:hypothetical protein